MGWSLSPLASPSMVVMLAPSAWTGKIVHDLRTSPLTAIVQAPHWLVSQPMWVPVRPSVSRRWCTSRVLGSTSCWYLLPLTVSETFTRAFLLELLRYPGRHAFE